MSAYGNVDKATSVIAVMQADTSQTDEWRRTGKHDVTRRMSEVEQSSTTELEKRYVKRYCESIGKKLRQETKEYHKK